MKAGVGCKFAIHPTPIQSMLTDSSFLLEGVLTLAIGIWSAFMMAPSPTQTKAWYRPKGWFSEREEKILVNRILRDDPSKGDMHNRQAISIKMLWKSLCDYHLWPIYAVGLTFGIPAGPPDQYLTLTLRNLGFDTFNSNLLSIPAQVATTVNVSVPGWFIGCLLIEIDVNSYLCIRED